MNCRSLLLQKLQGLELPQDPLVVAHVRLKDLVHPAELGDADQGIDYAALSLELIAALDELYSPLGILVPAFTYSFTKTGIYDRAHTPSEVGRFGEEIRLAFPPAQRTMNPVFSVIDCHSILKSDELSEDTAFGRHSLWNHLNEIGHICLNVNLQVPLINLRGVKTKFAGRCCNANPLSQRERPGSILCTVASAFLFRHHLHCRCHGSPPVY